MSSLTVFQRLANEVYRHTGITVDESKKSLVSNRVRRRVRALGLDGPEAYLDLLKTLDRTAAEVLEFIDVVTTHKTSFFRTASVWSWFKDMLDSNEEDLGSFEAWSCASSTGEEPYSLALLASSIAEKRPGFRWNVLATDVAAKTVARAAKGEYSKESFEAARSLAPGFDISKHFAAKEDGFAVRPELKKKMRFQAHNLMEPQRGRFDVAFLRNVLIYFNEEDKASIVRNVLGTIRPGGYLVIGESESLLHRDDGLKYIAPCIYQTSS